MLDPDAFRVAGNRPGLPCPVAAVLTGLEPADRKILEDALADPDVRHSVIEAVLLNEGIVLRQLVIGRHRRRVCRCAA